jgi:hypothetical protein
MYKFQHIRPNFHRGNDDNHQGAITVASNLDVDPITGIPNTLEFAVSFCSPKDNFNKELGRKIALIRAQNQDTNYYRKIPLSGNRKLKRYEISDLITATVFATMRIPRWALESF